LESDIISLLNNFGFPAAVAIILLYDKIKSNSLLKKAIENNTYILKEIKVMLTHRNI